MGYWTCGKEKEQVIARLYTSPHGQFLFGEWPESGTKYFWRAELTVVEHFADEKPDEE